MKIITLTVFVLLSLSVNPCFSDPVDDDPDEFLAEQGNKAAQKRLALKRQKAEEEQQKRAKEYAEKKRIDDEKERIAMKQRAELQDRQHRQEELDNAQKQREESAKDTVNGLINFGSQIKSFVN